MHLKEKRNVKRVPYLDHLYALFPGKQRKTNYEYFIVSQSIVVLHIKQHFIRTETRQKKILFLGNPKAVAL